MGKFGLTAIKKKRKKPNTLHDKETFLSAKSSCFLLLGMLQFNT
jgi:hypothetical protein